MLAYAFQVLNEEDYKRVATEDFEYASNLFAAILAKGIANQIKRGLRREYISKTESIMSPAGKINGSASIVQNSMLKKKLICDFDEFTEVEIFTLEEVKNMIKSGEIIDAKTITALAYTMIMDNY